MADEPHIGLIDAHPEGVRRDDHLKVAAHEGRLNGRALLSSEACVVVRRADTGTLKEAGHLLAVPAGAAIDDGGPQPGIGERAEQHAALGVFGALALKRHHIEGEVGAIKA